LRRAARMVSAASPLRPRLCIALPLSPRTGAQGELRPLTHGCIAFPSPGAGGGPDPPLEGAACPKRRRSGRRGLGAPRLDRDGVRGPGGKGSRSTLPSSHASLPRPSSPNASPSTPRIVLKPSLPLLQLTPPLVKMPSAVPEPTEEFSSRLCCFELFRSHPTPPCPSTLC